MNPGKTRRAAGRAPERPGPARSAARKVPHRFVLDYLAERDPIVRPMFGCHAVYVGGKMVLVLRHRDAHPATNGVWIATRKEHHGSLSPLFPSMRSIEFLGRGVTNWQVIPEEADDFESSVLTACDLILRGDPRIGTIPKPRRPR